MVYLLVWSDYEAHTRDGQSPWTITRLTMQPHPNTWIDFLKTRSQLATASVPDYNFQTQLNSPQASFVDISMISIRSCKSHIAKNIPNKS